MYVSMNWSCYILCTFINVEFNILVCDSTNMRTWVNDTVTGGINSNVLYLDQCIQCYVLIYLYVCHPDVPTTNNIDLPNIYPVFYYCTNCAPSCTLSFYVPTTGCD